MKLKPAWTDALYLLVLTLVFGLVATHWELSEHIATYSSFYESLQLDELPFLLVVLFFGMAWYSWRRSQEARQEVTERTRSEQKVQELLRHNSDLAQRLFTAQEDERRALALELHDEMAQTVTAIRTEAVLLSSQSSEPQEVQASAQRIAHAAQQMSQITRHMLQQLRPVALDSMGLQEALLALCQRWQESSGTVCDAQIQALPAQLSDYVNVTLYRLVQEALTNVARHAQASHVQVSLQTQDAHTLVLKITDNGIGIDHSRSESQGFGILGMRERVASLKGSFSLQTRPGQGVQLHIQLPHLHP
jgi:signal transduction histidine kinase